MAEAKKIRPGKQVYDLMEDCYAVKRPAPAQLQALGKALDEDPETLAIVGNLANTNIKQIIESMNSPTTGVIVTRYIHQLRRELDYSHAPLVVQLAADAVIIAWLRLQKWEGYYNEQTGGSQTIPQALFWERRLAAAQSRYLQALTTLARVQKLARRDPALQLNFAAPGSQQVNFAGDYVKGEQVQGAALPGKEGNDMEAMEGDFTELEEKENE